MIIPPELPDFKVPLGYTLRVEVPGGGSDMDYWDGDEDSRLWI